MQIMKYSLAVLSLSALAAASNAAHWELVSRADTNVPSPPIYSDSDVTRVLTYRTFDATVPTGSTMIYGSGTFKFYGEQARLYPTYSGGQTTWSHQDYLDSYYEFKFKWVADSISDTPPSLTTSVAAYGYSLERSEQVFFLHALFGGPWTIGINTISMTFPVYGPVWSVPGQTTFGVGVNNNWPQSGGLDVTINVPNIGLMYVRPQVVGGGSLSLDGSGNTIATISVLNAFVQEFSIPVSTSSGTYTVGMYVNGLGSCYKSVTQMLGLPVNY